MYVCIFTKRMCEQECLHSKRKILSPQKMKTLKALKETVRCVYGSSHGHEQSFSFTDTWAEENKTKLTVYRK